MKNVYEKLSKTEKKAIDDLWKSSAYRGIDRLHWNIMFARFAQVAKGKTRKV